MKKQYTMKTLSNLETLLTDYSKKYKDEIVVTQSSKKGCSLWAMGGMIYLTNLFPHTLFNILEAIYINRYNILLWCILGLREIEKIEKIEKIYGKNKEAL